MNAQTLKLVGIVCAAAAIASGSASAARADERLVAKVPFAFIVGDLRLPAGNYFVEPATADSDVLAIGSTDNRRLVYTLTVSSSADAKASQPELIFEKFGNQYFLARIVPPGGSEREIVLTPSIMSHEILRVDERSTD